MVVDAEFIKRLKVYQATAIFSVMFALVGFSYNVWRLEATEQNSTIREASFELLLQLAELEQLVFAAYFDQDPVGGNPRVGWIKVGLIADLSLSCGEDVRASALELKSTWAGAWETLAQERASADAVSDVVDDVRAAVHAQMVSLQ